MVVGIPYTFLALHLFFDPFLDLLFLIFGKFYPIHMIEFFSKGIIYIVKLSTAVAMGLMKIESKMFLAVQIAILVTSA